MERIKFVGGALCLDFVNTVGGRVAGQVLRDKLTSDDDLVEWGKLAGLPEHTRRANMTVLPRARAAREALYGILKSILDGGTPAAADLDLLNHELDVARKHQRIGHEGGQFVWTWTVPMPERVLGAVVQDAAKLLTSENLSRLRECPGHNCGWLFLDTSRNRSRQWCDMRDCGNLAKVRRFRNRNR
jgi:predicted RNA-binding Zn ribbon-like protein